MIINVCNEINIKFDCPNERGVLCNIPYPSETHLNSKSRETSFVHDIRLSNQIVLKFCSEYGSIIVVLCAKYRNDRASAS